MPTSPLPVTVGVCQPLTPSSVVRAAKTCSGGGVDLDLVVDLGHVLLLLRGVEFGKVVVAPTGHVGDLDDLAAVFLRRRPAQVAHLS